VDAPLGADNITVNSRISPIVNGIRDLDDFFPLYLNINDLLRIYPPVSTATGTSANFTYLLSQEDDAVKIVFTNLRRDHAFDYLRGDLTQNTAVIDTGYGPDLAQPAGIAPVTAVTRGGADLFGTSPAFLSAIQNDPNCGVILVEGCKLSSKPLVLTVLKNGISAAQISIPLKMVSVADMIRWYNIRNLANGTPPNEPLAVSTVRTYPITAVTATSLVPSAALDDPFVNRVNRENVVFIHGFNNDGGEGYGTACEVFKRLYWSGSTAAFHAVLWRGDDGSGANFQCDVGHVWQQAPFVRRLLTSFTSDTVVVAHSLGNMLALAAMYWRRHAESELCDGEEPVQFIRSEDAGRESKFECEL